MKCKPSVNRTAKMVPEGGFEPPTRGFSIQQLVNENNGIAVNDTKNMPNGINSLQKPCKPSNAQLIAELTRARCAFQLRTICAVMGVKL